MLFSKGVKHPQINLSAFAVAFTALFTTPTWAHFPLMACWYQQQALICEAGYSDGSGAVDYDVKVYDYSDNVIAMARTDAQSRVQLPRPQGDFYVVFDAGHEMPVERDGSEISEK
ncbi:hypothetical protein Q4519_02980 [Motilimonas sp. 1_MG-2023]|uniref:hypothetical protein n=1 Tax=Motilimonas sp. 1_MG-2023 TaxID=3062672 RepID=UPI0026E2464F|nr:hypothetical protein [Motilimonas sp. 1_MG-2023]MDO6524639.1 hypothetical protein [Motilimonas sp. 1_MG-2023]